MRHPRFHAAALQDDVIELDDKQSRHAVKVLRLGAGARIVLFDAHGAECEAEIVQAGGRVRARVIERRQATRELSIDVTAATAVPKGRRLEFMVQKLAELGAARWTPVTFERSVARLGESKRRRCEEIALEASKQCGRASVMSVGPEVPLEIFRARGAVLVGSPDAQASISEISLGSGTFIVGPEGGLTSKEEAALGGTKVRLGPTILRIETAAVAFMAAFAARA